MATGSLGGAPLGGAQPQNQAMNNGMAPLGQLATPAPAATPPAATPAATPPATASPSLGGGPLTGGPLTSGAYAPQPANGSGAPGQSDPGPTMANQQTGNFNTGYIDPATAAVHTVSGGPEYDQKVQDAYYNQQKQMLDPQWQQTQSDTETKLANMGLSRGSDAWNREADNLARQRTMAYNTAQNSAIMAGGAEATRQQQEEIARGNFANTATQQDYMNQIGSQQAQNAALTDQQKAAQGWQSFKTAEANAKMAADAQRAAAESSAGGMIGAASASAGASRYATDANERNAQMANDLATRGMGDTEQMNNYNINRQNAFDPFLLQNLAAGGQSPTGAPTFANTSGSNQAVPSLPNSTGAAQQQIDANNQSALGTNSMVSTLTSPNMVSLGGSIYNGMNQPYISPQTQANMVGLGAT
jgi:hypothetical protein